jgi:hypothetical protein
MAIIPGGQQIRTSSAEANLVNRGNALVKKMNKVYTMDDIVETVNADAGESYLVYTGFFQQSGTSNPVITTLENTTGGEFVTTRLAAGEYEFSLNGPTGIEGTPWIAISNSTSSGQKSITAVESIASGNCTGFIVNVMRNSDGTEADLNNENIHFELRLYS